MKTSELTYTQATQRLEAIVRRIEYDSPDVDELTKLVSEAIELSKYCRKKLTKADAQLAELVARLDETTANE